VTRFPYIDSARNGSSGATIRASDTSAVWNVAKAAARSAESSLREKRFRDRRRYHVERSSMNVEMRRDAPSAS
jgi:hypothetical protein